MNLLLIIALPFVISVLGLTKRSASWLPVTAALLMGIQLPLVAWLCHQAFMGETVIWRAFSMDGLAIAFTLITTIVAAAAMFQAAVILPAERVKEDVSNRRLCLFYTLSGLFIITMYAVLTAQNLEYLWMSMEATTLCSAPLIYYHRNRRSLEAAWKYFLLCSVGIAFALFGIELILSSGQAISVGGNLSFTTLASHANQFDPRLLRLGFIFCVLGFGTKAGLFPLHSWLPDAHSEAPAPISAMLSGALLNCALVAIWRISLIMNAAGQTTLVHNLLIPMGALTVLAASIMLIKQHDFKRIWAYSSVEHIGLLTLAIGIGSGELFVLQAFNHSIVKAALFLLAGSIMFRHGTKTLSKLSGLLNTTPVWGVLLAAATFAIAGSPPFGVFVSEWFLISKALHLGENMAGVAVIIGLTITFIALAIHVGHIIFGQAPAVTLNPAPVKTLAAVPAILLIISLLCLILFPAAMPILSSLVSGGAM